MAKRVVTLDIGASAVRLLEVRGGRVVRWGTALWAPGLVAEEGLVDFAGLGTQVRRLMRVSGIRARTAVASFSSVYLISRLIRPPLQTGETTAAQVPQLIREAIPTEDLRVQWQFMPPDGLGQLVLMIGAPETVVQQHVAVLRAAGIKPATLEARGLSLTRAVNRHAAIIANVEDTSLEVVLVVDGIPAIMRTLALPQGEDAAERANFVERSIRQALSFYEARSPERPVASATPIFLTGSRSADPAIREVLSANLDYPLEELDPGLEYPSHLPVAQYAANLGLALRVVPMKERGMSIKEVDLQAAVALTNIDLKPASRRTIRVPPWVRVALAVGAIGLALNFLLYQRFQITQEETLGIRDRTTILERQVGTRRTQLAQVSQMEAAIGEFQTLVAPQGDLTRLFEEVRELAPPGITITSFTVSPTDVGMSGQSESSDQIIQFINALRANGEFTLVAYPQTQTGALSFSITATRLGPKK